MVNNIDMKKKVVRLTESDLTRIVRKVINEQKPSGKYRAGGTKFCYFGSCRVDIKVIDTETSQIVTSKGVEGKDVKTLYPQVIKSVQDELKSKKISDVTLPTLEQLEDTSPK